MSAKGDVGDPLEGRQLHDTALATPPVPRGARCGDGVAARVLASAPLRHAVLNGRVRSVVALLHTHIPFWLATLAPAQVNEAARPKLIRYQEELVDVLSRLFYGDPGVPARAATDPAVAALEQRFDLALRELRLARAAWLAEQQLRAEVGAVRQELTDITELVHELHEVIPVTPKQAEYIQRAIKQLAHRASRRRGRPSWQRGQSLPSAVWPV